METVSTTNKRPSYTHRSRDAEEIKTFSLKEANKELMTNLIDEIRKRLGSREYKNWKVEDLRGLTQSRRAEHKTELLKKYPSILAGIVAQRVGKNNWLPGLIVSIEETVRDKAYYGVIVYWNSCSSEYGGLTYLNNGMNTRETDFSFLATEGKSGNRKSDFAVGEKGRGFLLAVHYLLQQQQILRNVNPNSGVEFRVGQSVGECTFRPENRTITHDKQCFKIFETRLRGGAVAAHGLTSSMMRGAADDEVSITALGCFRTANQSPENVFSGFYGVFPPAVEFIHDKVTLYTNHNSKEHFYLCNQIVLYGKAVGKVGINYSGTFSVTSDRLCLAHSVDQDTAYFGAVAKAVGQAVASNHPVVPYIMEDLLGSTWLGEHNICHCLTYSGIPSMSTSLPLDQIKLWKDNVNQVLNERSEASNTVEHYITNQDSEISFIEKMGFTPYKARDGFARLMQSFGVYPPIREFARDMLLAAPESGFTLPARCIEALEHLFPNIFEHRIHVGVKPEPRVTWQDHVLYISDFGLAELLQQPTYEWMDRYLDQAWRDKHGDEEPLIGTSEWFEAFAILRDSPADERSDDRIYGTPAPNPRLEELLARVTELELQIAELLDHEAELKRQIDVLKHENKQHLAHKLRLETRIKKIVRIAGPGPADCLLKDLWSQIELLRTDTQGESELPIHAKRLHRNSDGAEEGDSSSGSRKRMVRAVSPMVIEVESDTE